MALSKTKCHRELVPACHRPACEIQLPEQRNVAIGRRTELPVHAKVVHQVAPAVACAHKPTAHAGESATGAHGQRPIVLPRQQRFVPGNVHRPRRIARPAVIQVRRKQHIHLQPRQQVLMPFVCFQLHMRQNHRVMRVADDLLGQLVAALGIAVHVAHAQRLRVYVLEGRLQVALLLVDECLSIRDQEFHVANLGAVDGGVIDLVEDAVRAGEPHPA